MPFRIATGLLCLIVAVPSYADSPERLEEISIRVGDKVETVQRALHTSFEPVAGSNSDHLSVLHIENRGLWVFFDAANEVKSVRFAAPFDGIVSGIRIGDSRSDVIAKLGQPVFPTSMPNIPMAPALYNLKYGTTIRFSFDIGSKVNAMLILGGVATFVAADRSANSPAPAASNPPLSSESQYFINLVTNYRGKAFCPPPEATSRDAAQVVSQAVHAHPEWENRYSDEQALDALAIAYPCNVNPNTPLNQMGGRKVRVAPSGEYATIQMGDAEAVVLQLRDAGLEKAYLAARVANQSNAYMPPVLFALAQWYYKQGKIDDALFWLNAAGLRGSFDAKICTDTSAQSAIAELSQKVSPDLYRVQWQDPTRIKSIVDRVIEWDRNTPSNYDHRWISLHGLRALNSSLGMTGTPGPLTLPQTQWSDIAEKNREKFHADMYRYAAGDRRTAN